MDFSIACFCFVLGYVCELFSELVGFLFRCYCSVVFEGYCVVCYNGQIGTIQSLPLERGALFNLGNGLWWHHTGWHVYR